MDVTYYHRSYDVKHFIDACNNKLPKMNSKNKHYILGDIDININVNIMSSTQSMYSDAYLNMLTSNVAFLLSDKQAHASNQYF